MSLAVYGLRTCSRNWPSSSQHQRPAPESTAGSGAGEWQGIRQDHPLDALYPRYAAFLRVRETPSSSKPAYKFGHYAHDPPRRRARQAQVLWGSISSGRHTCCVRRRTCRCRQTHRADHRRRLHQLTANDIGAMGRFGAKVIVFILNNSGYLSSGRWKTTRTGPTTILRLGTTPNCRRRLGARIGSPRGRPPLPSSTRR